MKKTIIFHVALLAVVLATGIFSYLRYWNIASVNGRAISRLSYIKSLEQRGGKQTLDSMIEEALILNEGNSKGIKVDQKTIDDEITKIEARLKSQNQTLDSALVASGMTKADLVTQIKIKKIEEALSAPKTEVTQAQIDEFLKANKAQLPANMNKDQLQQLAKDELTAQAKQQAADAWLSALKQSAKIVYK